MSDKKPVAWDEPVAWIRKRDDKLALSDGGVFGDDWTPLYYAALAQPEKFCDTHCTWRDHHPDCAIAGSLALPDSEGGEV
jgi:hypothetical protein